MDKFGVKILIWVTLLLVAAHVNGLTCFDCYAGGPKSEKQVECVNKTTCSGTGKVCVLEVTDDGTLKFENRMCRPKYILWADKGNGCADKEDLKELNSETFGHFVQYCTCTLDLCNEDVAKILRISSASTTLSISLQGGLISGLCIFISILPIH